MTDDGLSVDGCCFRVVSDECELLPSRERCPYLIVAELLQTERHTRCGSAKVYTKGAYHWEEKGCILCEGFLSGRETEQ